MPADLKKNGQRRLCFSTPHPPLRFESDFHSLPPIFPPHTTSSYIPSLLFDSRKKAKARAKSRAPHTHKEKNKASPKKNKGQQQPGQQQLPQRFLRIKPRNEGRAASPGRCCGSGCCKKKKERNTMFFCPHSERRRPRERSVLPAAQASSKNPSRWRLLWIEGQVAGVE